MIVTVKRCSVVFSASRSQSKDWKFGALRVVCCILFPNDWKLYSRLPLLTKERKKDVGGIKPVIK